MLRATSTQMILAFRHIACLHSLRQDFPHAGELDRGRPGCLRGRSSRVGAAHPGIALLAGVSVEDRRFGPQTADTTGSISAAIAPIVTPRVLYVGSDDGVRLHGSGAHWTRFGTGLPNVRVTDLKLN